VCETFRPANHAYLSARCIPRPARSACDLPHILFSSHGLVSELLGTCCIRAPFNWTAAAPESLLVDQFVDAYGPTAQSDAHRSSKCLLEELND
jgi:hypothetical protein